MELEINPEPTPEERAAIQAALAELLAPPSQTRSAWWASGITDAPDDNEGERSRTSPAL
jgi:hypothetical protein